MKKKKLVLLGLDGADWRIIDPLIKEGALPNFALALKKGVRADLRSTIPALTAPSWTCIFTGLNPGKHGIFDFFKYANGKFHVSSGLDNRGAYIWELLSDFKVLAYNIPCIFPVRRSNNGIVVSGFATPSPKHRFAEPEEICHELLQKFSDYDFKPLEMKMLNAISSKAAKSAKDPILRSVRQKKSAASYLMREKEWDAAFIVFSEPDWVQHCYLHEFFAAEKKSESIVGSVYIEIDGIIGQILEGNHNLLVVSDHGFTQIKRNFLVNSFLMQKGLIKLKKERIHKRILRSLGIYCEDFLSMLPRIVYKFAKPPDVAIKSGIFFPSRKIHPYYIDTEKSDAFLFGASAVYLTPGASVDRVLEVLRGAKDEHGRAPFRSVMKASDFYAGREVPNGPQILACPNEGVVLLKEITAGKLSSEISPLVEKNGTHAENGIFLASGPDFVIPSGVGQATVLDIAPTILSFFDYSPHPQMDGKVLPVVKPSAGAKSTLATSTKISILNILRKKSLPQPKRG